MNSRADLLAKATVCSGYSKKTKLIMKQDLTREEMNKFFEVNIINAFKDLEEEKKWMKEIMGYLQDSVLPEGKRKA